ncbi:MAG: hypothetical protein BGP13_13585 [Sphingobacteriales bacterium 40-81]|nr:MAG: hypothetical protein BGP13_13585 [Sphingobacteriales bacterium 40-81]
MKYESYAFMILLFYGMNCFKASAQTLDQIIANHIKAIGGKEKIKQVKTVTIKMTTTNTITQPETVKLSVNSLTRITNGKGYRRDIESETEGVKTIQSECFTDNTGQISGWTTAPPMPGITEIAKGDFEPMSDTKPRSMSEQEYNAGKDQIYVGNPFINYPSKGMEVKLIKKFNGQYCIGVKTDFWARLYYIDITTFYITKIEENGMGGTKGVTIFKNYKNVSGIVFPHSIAINTYMPRGMADALFGHGASDLFDNPATAQNPKKDETPYIIMISTVTGITVNEPIDSSIYNFPED